MSGNVTICAPFRNSARHAPRFVQGLLNLRHPSNALRFICVEGDSVDDTWGKLQTWLLQDERVSLLKCNTGKPHYGNVVHPERFAVLAQVFNTALDAVDLAWSDYVLFTPSDVCFGRDILTRLMAHDKDMIAPFFWGADGLFHDTWGFTHGNQEFGKFGREQVSSLYGDAPIEMDTVGGMVLMRADVLRAGCRYTASEVDRGLCKAAKAQGFTVWADPATYIHHL